MMISKYYVDYTKTSLGMMRIEASQDALKSIHFIESGNANVDQSNPNEITAITKQQLQEYFLRKRECFDLPLNADGTDFQKTVWKQLCQIPYGQTCTYGEIAVAIGKHKASRAVGLANGKNPLTIVVPCHRIIGANGTLTGYASGVERKAKLLNLESPNRSLF